MENEGFFSSIVKRNGTKEAFNSQKISAAIAKAGETTGEFGQDTANKLAIKALSLLLDTIEDRKPTVEKVQDAVEEVLLYSKYKKTARAYILYRDQHSKIREIYSAFNIDLVDQYLEKIDWQVNENSNMSYSLQGLNNYISSGISKIYWLNKIYPENVRKAHSEGDLHLHDLGLLGAYCAGWDLQDLLLNGFKGASGKSEAKPAKHFRTVLGQIVNFFYTLQGESAGAQAFSNFDTLLAPFIYYDKLNYEEVKQALQEFLFNINVPTRVGFQTPFTNLTMDLTVAPYYKNEPVIIGGKHRDKKYGEFQKEIDRLNQAFLELMLAGDAKGRVFTFPIPTYNITKDFDWNNKNISALWDITAKYGVPYFANFINSDMKPEDARSMCCRLRIDNRELRKRGGGLFGASPLTGSIGVVTINLPRIGYLAKNESDFIDRLKENMDIAKQSLEIKRNVLEKFTSNNLYPYVGFYLRIVKERFNKYWKNHFSTIGIIGLNEACINLFGEGVGSIKGKSFGEKILDFMREILINYQKETENNYNLEATPAEGASYRLARLDIQKYPDIISASKTIGMPFYTNSSQLPVDYTEDIFENLDLQDSMQAKYTGGTVLHMFVGERIKDTESLKNFIKIVCENYSLPYFSITPTFSVCPQCGYIEGEHTECPKCKQEKLDDIDRQIKVLEDILDNRHPSLCTVKEYKEESGTCQTKSLSAAK
ncbi:ribonucleoside triphosphate reductase [Candidatus Endomicrobiellum trichonymphae]|uniref:ribonucleoside triphosphate reductase n=1 Tax=Endomicrobium trichonymphae TaxID=1408204 RepID=UPI00086513AC|nr:ribonucleoside triphosphate reductase [Candidatus Endomicrobium trichonymphae]BAV59124.1 N-terminal domain of ribonucleoside-triphosphate reductase [Candidatus Endomicrobium trichonymphae]